MAIKHLIRIVVASSVLLLSANAPAFVMTFGDKDGLGFGFYGDDEPTDGSSLEGLTPGDVTFAFNSYLHLFPQWPFDPEPTEFFGTDQIYVGSDQTVSHDGYAGYAGRAAGPQVITMDYNPIVQAGHTVDTLTLGIAADDFQFPLWGNPFVALVNGHIVVDLINELNGLNQTGPQVQYFSLGLDTAILDPSNELTLTIGQAGTGGDGWAIDFLTIGVTTSPMSAPLPPAIILLGAGLLATAGLSRRTHSK